MQETRKVFLYVHARSQIISPSLKNRDIWIMYFIKIYLES